MTKKERDVEHLEWDKSQSGRVHKNRYEVGMDPKLKKQQQDHVTVGKAMAGMSSALPRLEMYEQPMISNILALTSPKDHWDAAAAYCIDIGRFVVTNDDQAEILSGGIFKKVEMGIKWAKYASRAWDRIKVKYGKKFPELLKLIGSRSSDVLKTGCPESKGNKRLIWATLTCRAGKEFSSPSDFGRSQASRVGASP